jgi:hypothetical protein
MGGFEFETDAIAPPGLPPGAHATSLRMFVQDDTQSRFSPAPPLLT